MKTLIVIIAFSMIIRPAVAQQHTMLTISGTVRDATTSTPLPNATIEVKAQSLEMIANLDGAFTFHIPENATGDSLQVSHIGYKTFKKRIADIQGPQHIILESAIHELRAVTITSRTFNLREIDKALRAVKDNLYAYEIETSNALYNLFLTSLEEQGQDELLKQCNYDLTAYDEEKKAFFKKYTAPYQKPQNKKDTTEKNYTNFPAVNVPHGAAVLFCQWLTEQYNTAGGKKRFSKVKFRLPTLKEWQIAALGYDRFQTWNVEENMIEVFVPSDTLNMKPKQGERKTIRVGHDVLYPWYGNYYWRNRPQNYRGCFLGNFKVTNPAVVCPHGRVAYDGWKMMSPTAAYYPNDIGLFDVAGNVAEMIDEKGKACGGSWNNTPAESTIHSVKQYKRPSDSIGFRVFMDVVDK